MALRSSFTVGRIRPHIRLRNWPAGRISVLKLMASRLEAEINDSLQARAEQSAKRKYNPEIPIIIEEEISPGFRQFEINFPIPPGLGGAGRGASSHPDRQLLFYEIQHDTTGAFADPIIVETAQTHIVIGGVGKGETRYFRMRVINTKFQASAWTPTVSATAASGRLMVTEIKDSQTRLIGEADGASWQTILSYKYGGLDNSAICVSATVSVGANPTDSETYRSGPGHVQFRWLRDGVEIGDRCVMSAIPGYGGVTAGGGNSPLAYGSFITPFQRLGLGTFDFVLQAKKRPGSEWRGNLGDGLRRSADPMIFVRNGKILEVLEVL